MEYKDDERSSLNGHGPGQPESPKQAAVPPTLLPAVLSHLGLAGSQVAKGEQAVAALRDEKSPVRVAAVRSLGEGREASSLPLLVSALHDPAWEVRAAAAWALGACGEHAPVEILLEALADEDGTVRAAALRALSGLRAQVPPASLARMLQDADWQVRDAAASTVEERGEQGPLAARSHHENDAQGEAAQTPAKPSHPGFLSPALPSLPLTARRAMQLTVLGDRYQLQGPLGRGGMATIYRGWDRRMDRVVAIKVLRDLYTSEPKFVERFEREAKAASALHHPNIVQAFDYGWTDGNYYIVMELVEGTDLRHYLRSRAVLDSTRAVIIAHDVALGLGAAHRRTIVHRDVKPQNILVGRDGSIRLTDFGIASVYQDLNAFRLTTTGMTLGTVHYMPPEQARGEIVSPAADVYALGIVMYEMLTGRTPFAGENAVVVAMQHIQDVPAPPSQYNPAIPPALEEIILRCLEKVPQMRYGDGSQLARALESLSNAEFAGAILSTRGLLQSPGGQIPSRSVNSGRAAAQGEQPLTPSPDHARPIMSWKSSSTRPQEQGGALPRNRRPSRFSTAATALGLLAASFLLVFSLYLGVQLGIIKLPFLNNGGASPTPTAVTATVPKLLGDDYATALRTAQDAGFQLRVKGYTPPATPPASYIVTNQSPDPKATAQKGSTIEVTMQPKTTIVPTIPKNSSLVSAEVLLQSAGLTDTIIDAGTDSTLPPNTVVKVSPAPGSSIDGTTSVTLYVKNYTTGTPGVRPTPSPTP